MLDTDVTKNAGWGLQLIGITRNKKSGNSVQKDGRSFIIKSNIKNFSSRLLALAICIVCLIGFAGCGGEDVRKKPQDQTKSDNNENNTDPPSTTDSALSFGTFYSCALFDFGAVKCWGDNSFSQLGDGTTTNSTTPVDVTGLSSGVATISSGYRHSCAVLDSGAVKCWGNNSWGQLGDGSTTDSTTPVEVTGLSSGVAAISSGSSHTCALLNSGAIRCWGHNVLGQLGDGSTTNRNTPVDVTGLSSGVAAISLGNGHTCVLLISGAVKCWGFNISGQLGDGTTTSRNTPVDVIGLSSGVAAISSGSSHTCALLNSGAIRCWGYNISGRLGDGTTTNRNTPVDVIGLSSGVAAISAGNGHTCVVLISGAVKCWGYNFFGQLGNVSNTSSSIPVDVFGLSSGVATVTLGGDHTCAILDSGAIKWWGRNNYGQYGDGTVIDRRFPVDAFNF